MSTACLARHWPSCWGWRWCDRFSGLIFTWIAFANVAALVVAEETSGPTAIVRIEEDWELVVTEPDADAVAPQVTTVISPYGDLNDMYASIELNHQTQPEFSPGGVHLQTWNGEEPLATHDSSAGELLHAGGETVRWTQSMHLTGGALKFEVQGSSTSWGAFGGNGELQSTNSTELESLSGYRPRVSTANSGISFAANRVERLVLKEVRYYSAQGLLARDTAQRVVHPK